jgi:hypothetical protein
VETYVELGNVSLAGLAATVATYAVLGHVPQADLSAASRRRGARPHHARRPGRCVKTSAARGRDTPVCLSAAAEPSAVLGRVTLPACRRRRDDRGARPRPARRPVRRCRVTRGARPRRERRTGRRRQEVCGAGRVARAGLADDIETRSHVALAGLDADIDTIAVFSRIPLAGLSADVETRGVRPRHARRHGRPRRVVADRDRVTFAGWTPPRQLAVTSRSSACLPDASRDPCCLLCIPKMPERPFFGSPAQLVQLLPGMAESRNNGCLETAGSVNPSACTKSAGKPIFRVVDLSALKVWRP